MMTGNEDRESVGIGRLPFRILDELKRQFPWLTKGHLFRQQEEPVAKALLKPVGSALPPDCCNQPLLAYSVRFEGSLFALVGGLNDMKAVVYELCDDPTILVVVAPHGVDIQEGMKFALGKGEAVITSVLSLSPPA